MKVTRRIRLAVVAIVQYAVVRLVQLSFWMALGLFSPIAMAAGDTVESATGFIAVELNLAEPIADGCRLSFVIRNRTAQAFAVLQWDLVFFDRDGLIVGRTAAEAAPLPMGKTSMKQYDVPGLACNQLLRVLLNDVMRCEIADGGEALIGCLELIEPSSRSAIQFFK